MTPQTPNPWLGGSKLGGREGWGGREVGRERGWVGGGGALDTLVLHYSVFFVFKILLLPSYRFKYYDYFVNWSSCMACSWFVSLDSGFILALWLNMLDLTWVQHSATAE